MSADVKTVHITHACGCRLAGGCALHRSASELADALLGVCAEVVRLRPDAARTGTAGPAMLAAQEALARAGRLA